MLKEKCSGAAVSEERNTFIDGEQVTIVYVQGKLNWEGGALPIGSGFCCGLF